MSQTIDFLRKLVSIDSVNPSLVQGGAGEQQIAEAIAAQLRAAGVDAELQQVRPGRPNVIGVIEAPTSGPSLVLCGHLDTVGVEGMAAPFDPVLKDGRLYGRGSQDMKGGLAAIVGAVTTLARTGAVKRGRVIVAGVMDEEDASLGASAFVDDWLDTPENTVAVVAEPTDLEIGIAHKGFAWLKATTYGIAAHGSRPGDGRDAILRMGRLLSRLEAHQQVLERDTAHPLLGAASLHTSFIEGGREWSTYPDRCELRLERRTLPGEGDDEPVVETSRILESLVQEDGEFAATAELVLARRPYEISERHPLVGRMREAARAAGLKDELCGVSFWADSAVLGEAGIPTILFGPGGAGLHGIEEYVNVADVTACESALLNLSWSLGISV